VRITGERINPSKVELEINDSLNDEVEAPMPDWGDEPVRQYSDVAAVPTPLEPLLLTPRYTVSHHDTHKDSSK
jgi:hypothetical protein